jgi:hypothetical protein
MDYVTGEWGKLHNEELNNLYCSPNIFLVIKCSTYWDGRGVYKVLVGKPEGKRRLGRPRHRRKENIKLNLQEVGCGGYGLDWAGSRER